MIKGSIQEEDITHVDIYIPKVVAPTYIKQVLTDIKGDNNTIIGDCNTPLSPLDSHSDRKSTKTRIVFARGWRGQESWELLLRVSVGEDETILEMDGGDGSKT